MRRLLAFSVVLFCFFTYGCGDSSGGKDVGIGDGDGGGGDDGGLGGDDASGGDAPQDGTAQDADGGDSGDPGTDGAEDGGDGYGDGDGDEGGGDDGGGDDGGDAGGDQAQNWSRGIEWVRTHPMFISGLTVYMGAPPVAFVDDYFDAFNANAVHLWQNGLPNEMNAWAAAGNPGFRWVSWVLPDGTSMDGNQVAGGYPADSPGRIGYQISDEPRTWEDLYSYEDGFAALRAHDPDGLLILNFTFQAEEIDAFLEYFCTQMDGDVISYDRYSRSSNVYETMQLFRSKGLECGKPYWRYMNAYMDENLEEEHHDSDLRWDAFSGMLFGYTGHTWFLYQVNDNPILNPVVFEYKNSFTAPKTAEYALIGQINEEMANLGRAITQLTSTEVRYVPTLDVYLPPGMTRWAPGAGGDPYITDIDMAPNQFFLEILVGHFVDDAGRQYVMVQNVRHEHGSFPIDRSDAGTIRISFDFSSAPAGFDKTAVLSLNRLTGQVENVPMTSIQGDTGYLDVLLEAGDPFLFKYNDGVPFALGP